MAFNRELSQFAAYLDLDAAAKYIGITTSESTNVGIGITNPGSKLSVVGDGNFTGVVTATQFYGNLDYSYILNATAGVRTEISATSSDLGSLSYDSNTGVFAYSGVTTSNIRNQFSASSSDIGTLSYNSSTGEFSLAGVTTSSIRNQFSAGTGVAISNGEVSIGQAVGTSDAVTFASVDSTGTVTASDFATGTAGQAIGINTDTISGPSTLVLDPASVGDNTGTVVIKGDLQIDGTTTTINSTELVVDDKNITLASGAVNDAAADGGGITIESGDGNKTFQFSDANDSFQANIGLDVTSGNVYKIGGTEVLSSDTLGSGVVNSSLTSVGTLGKLDVGNVNSSGIVTATGGFSGNVTGNVTGNADTATALETARDFSISGDATASAIAFDGTANVGLALTLADTTVTAGSYGSSAEIPTFTVDSKGRLTAAGTVSVSTGMTVAGDSGSETINLLTETLTISGGTNLTSSAASDTVTINLDDNISLTSVSASGVITATGGFSGDLTGNVTGDLTGNADTATALETARDFSISGDAEASAISFDGTANVGLALTLTDTAVTPGSYGSSSEIPTFTVDSKGRLTAAGTVSVSTGMTVAGDSGSETIDLLTESLTIAGGTNLTSSAAADTVTINLDDNISLVSVNASGVVTATGGFSGDLTGNVTGDVTGNVTGDLTGEVNSAAFDTNASGVVVTGIATATGGFSGNLTGDVTGNADTATALETARDFSISGDAASAAVSFDGTGNVGLAVTLATVNSDVGSYGSSTAIPIVTVNEKGLVTAVSTASVGTALTVAGDSGSEDIDLLTETLTISGGTNLTSSASGNAVTVNLDDNISLTSVVASGVVTAAQFVTGASGEAIGINTNTISGPETITIDPAAVGDNTGKVVIKGDLQIDGTTTTINSTIVTVDDLNILLADGAANDAAANGGGFTVQSGDGNKTFQFEATGDNFGSSENVNLASGKVYKINNTEVLSSDTLGSGVVNSSLTSVGTLGKLDVGNVNSSGIVTATGGFSGDLTGDVTGNADTATALETARDFSISGDAEAAAISFDGTANVGFALTLANTGVAAGSYGSATAIPTFTVDSKGRLTVAGEATVSTGMTVAGDSGSETIDLLTETLTIAGGTNLTSSAAADTVTINLDDNISLVSVNASGVITATGGFIGDVTGNADTATALETARDFSISGDATASAISFDGTANVGLALTLANTGVSAGSYGSATEIPTFTVDSKGRLTVAGTAAVSTGMTVAGDSGSETIDLLSETLTIAGGTNLTSSAASDTVTINLDDNISLVSVNASGVITATGGFSGNLTGDVTGDLTGNVTGNVTGDLTGNVYATSGISTFNNVDINGTLTDGNDGVGSDGQILVSVGTGISWTTLTDVLPQARTTQSNTATSGQTAFSFNYNVNYLDVFINGVKLSSSEYTATNGTDITLGEGAFAGDIVEFVSYNTVGSGAGSVSSLNDLSDVTLTSSSSGQILSYDGSGWVNTSNISGITSVTATTFYGDGSQLTGIDASSLKDSNGTIRVQANTSGAVVTGILSTSSDANVGGNLTVTGDLTVNGTTTTINSTTLTVDDLNIVVASGAADATAANGAGLTVDGASATFTYASTGDKWVSNKDVEAPNFNSTSDRNLKDNIRVVEGASELVGKLEGVHFTWKENGQETIGVIAQQIEEHLPQLVQTGETHKTVNYNGLIGVLIEAVKEQGQQIEALKAEIAELKK